MAEVNTFFKQEFKQEDELKRSRGMVFLISETTYFDHVVIFMLVDISIIDIERPRSIEIIIYLLNKQLPFVLFIDYN